MGKDNSDLERWDMLPDGKVRMDLATDAGVTAVLPHHVVLRVDYVSSQHHLDRFRTKKQKPHRIQVAMSPEAAIELASLLGRYAKRLQSTVPPREKQN